MTRNPRCLSTFGPAALDTMAELKRPEARRTCIVIRSKGGGRMLCAGSTRTLSLTFAFALVGQRYRSV